MQTIVKDVTYSYADPDPLPHNARLAKLVGSLHYDTGKPCKRGHRSRRYTPTGACLACERERQNQRNEARALRRLTGL